jgi:two-component system response regulator MprA
MKVLVVDDEEAVRVALQRALNLHGYEVVLAADGLEGRTVALATHPDMILLDVTMPNMDGLRMCRQLRQAGDRTPVIVLTARSRLDDRVEGLDAGADDYLVKPFALKELLARMRALSRRVTDPAEERQVRSYADLRLDVRANIAHRGEREIPLSRTEGRLLELLLRYPEIPVSRAQIFGEVWSYDFGTTSNPHEVYVGYLRRKLEAGGEPRLIQTVRGVGYMIRSPRGSED